LARTLVTGGQGFIGSALVRSLVEGGHRVRVLDLESPSFEGLEVQGVAGEVEILRGDVSNPADAARAVEGIERVFHLGAVTLVGEAAADPLHTYRSNTEGTWVLLEACRRGSIDAVVVASSDKAYGPSPDLPYRESFELAPFAPYEGSKAACDVIARSYAAAWGTPVAVTRLANVYGGGDLNYSRLIPELMAALVGRRAPRIRSDGSPRRDFLHISDAVAGYRAVVEHVLAGFGRGEAFNIGTGSAVSVAQVIDKASDLAGGDLAFGAEFADLAHGEIDEQYVDPAKVGEATGWRPEIDLEAGLREAFEWYGAHRDLCP
jgi:CDP-glucose 4,6-dehydratase